MKQQHAQGPMSALAMPVDDPWLCSTDSVGVGPRMDGAAVAQVCRRTKKGIASNDGVERDDTQEE